MTKKYLLELTDEQAEILGFALGVARRQQLESLSMFLKGFDVAQGIQRITRIDEVRDLLDIAPEVDA
jgi:hypothetical protein